MTAFTDNKGREWKLEINVQSLKDVRSQIEVDGQPFDLLGGEETWAEIYHELEQNPITLCNVLYVLCAEQCKEQKVTDEDFGRGLAGMAIDRATEALLKEYVDFFPARRRQLLTQILSKAEERMQSATARGIKEFSEIDWQKVEDEAFEEATKSGKAFTKLPVTQELIPPDISSGS